MNESQISRIANIVSENMQDLILSYISKHGDTPLTTMSASPEFRGKNFGQIMKSAEVLVRRGKLTKENFTKDGVVYKKGPKFGLKTASYDSDTWFILVGSYSIVADFSRIFDCIHINGCGGHSFCLVIKTGFGSDEKPVINAGSFDGDGAQRVTYICAGVEGQELISDNVYHEVKTIDVKTGTGRGDSILIVKGTETGIEALKEIFDNVMNVVKTSGERAQVFTDDQPEIYCGSYCEYDEEDKDNFGFYFTTHQNFNDPVGFVRDNGYTLDFYRG